MIGRTNVGGAGGGGKSTITFYGGKNEVITYTGAENGTVTLDESGAGTATLKNGLYVFTAGLSGIKLTKCFYTNATARMRPERFIYWYGVLGAEITHSGTGSLTYNNTTFRLRTSGDGGTAYAKSSIDCSADTKITVKCATVSLESNYSLMGYKNTTAGLKSGGSASVTYVYATGSQPFISLYNYQDRRDYADVQEWYLGNREAG